MKYIYSNNIINIVFMAIDKDVIEFAKRWKNKTLQYPDVTIELLFDKFISFYIAYNAMYHQIAFQEKRNSKVGDKTAATKYVIEYLDPHLIINEIDKDPEAKNSIPQLINILRENQFFIHINFDNSHNKQEDIKLAEELLSSSIQTKSLAITKCLYQIRCNIIHGSKSLEEKHRIILIPANILLLKLVNLLIQTIGNRNN